MHQRLLFIALVLLPGSSVLAGPVSAGVGRADITDRSAGRVNDPLFVKALVLRQETTTAAIITVDAVAIGDIGRIPGTFLGKLRARLQQELGIEPAHVLVNASHCHGVVVPDILGPTVQAVQQAVERLTPVRIGVGAGNEDRISENRRLKLKNGSEVDLRRAYAMPHNDEVAAVGPIDPQVGVLRIDHLDGRPLAVVYHFACHPIMNPPSKGNSADFPGFASQLLEEALGGDAMALFIQGCAGDINPVRYKQVQQLPDAEPLGHKLGLAVLQAYRRIDTKPDAKLQLRSETLALPIGLDLERRQQAIQAEQVKLVKALQPTDINFQTFVPMYLQHRLAPEFPGYYSQGYLQEEQIGKDEQRQQDTTNRQLIDRYLQNIRIMERLTRLNVNAALLQKHHQQLAMLGSSTLSAEMNGLQVGDFRLLTFPGELTVEIGLNIKRSAQPFTFVAGYTNGYLYYLPTEQQRQNTGYAQEDCDCLIAPAWQGLFETKAKQMLERLR